MSDNIRVQTDGDSTRVVIKQTSSKPITIPGGGGGGSSLPHYMGDTEVTPTESEQTLITQRTIVDSNITVHGIDPEYVGSEVPRNDSDDLSISGDTMTAPAGYYAESASASVQSGSAATPTTQIDANPTLSVDSYGQVSASVSASQSITPTVSEGYVTAGVAGTVSVLGGASMQLPTVPGQTAMPSTEEQTIVTSGKYTTGNIKVSAMPTGTMGTPVANKGAVSNHSIDVTPSVTNAAGYIDGGTVTGNAVTVSASELVSGSTTITTNTTTDVTNLASVVTNVQPALQSKTKTYTPTTSAQTETVTADAGNYGLSSVDITVNAMPNATWRAGSTIDYSPTISVDANGLISADYTYNTTVKPISGNGYAEASHAYPVKTTGSATSQLSTQGATVITPTTSAQTAVAAGKYTTGAVTVDAMPNGSKGGSSTTVHSQDANEHYYTTNYGNATAGYYPSSAFNPAAQVILHRQSETVTPDTTTQTVTPTNSYHYLDSVTVDPIPPEYVVPSGTLSITSNGTADCTAYAAVDVAVSGGSPNLQTKSKSYTPTETAQSESVTADAGYDGLDTVSVSVGAISSTYVGTGITRRDSTDLTASAETVNVPAGYYENAASKSLTTVTHPSPTVNVSNTGLCTASHTQSTGYVTGSTTTAQTQIATTPATTYHPSTTNQTISIGRYLTGTQTITAVTHNLTADKIVSGFTAKIGDSSDDDCVASIAGTASGGGGIGTLLKTYSIGSYSTSATSATDMSKSFDVTGIYGYDLLILETSVDTVVNSRHTATINLIWLTAGTTHATQNGATIASNKMNMKISSSAVTTTRQSTTAYGIYANSATIGTANNGTCTIALYSRYNSTQTGTINGSYTARVYGVKLYDLIGG